MKFLIVITKKIEKTIKKEIKKIIIKNMTNP